MSSYTVFRDFSCDVNKACRIRLEATVYWYFGQAQLLFCYVFHAKDERCEQVNVCVCACTRIPTPVFGLVVSISFSFVLERLGFSLSL